MKKIIHLISLAGIILFSGCEKRVVETITYQINEPVFMSAEDFRKSVKVTNETYEIENYGKICFYDGFLYISESGKGIHIVNNTNPANPRIVGFIELLGNADLAIRNGLLYADAYVDLVWFDVTNPAQPELEGRLENVFARALPPIPNEYGYDWNLCYGEQYNEVIVGWELKQRTENIEYYTGWFGWPEKGTMLDTSSPTSNGGSSNGVNGSMSRFGLYKDYLYTVIENQMSIFDLSAAEPKKAVENLYIGWNVETIFSYKENMFMGTPTGLLIYSVEDPLCPEYCSAIWHVYGCDPVVVEDDLAYVTIHSGNFCGQNNNELFIIDVSDVKKPKQIVSYTMKSPKGLGIDNGTLFLCDDGLQIFNAENPQTLLANRLAHYQGMDGYDVIPFNNTLMMIADNGLYQYDYTDVNNIKELSLLKIGKKK